MTGQPDDKFDPAWDEKGELAGELEEPPAEELVLCGMVGVKVPHGKVQERQIRVTGRNDTELQLAMAGVMLDLLEEEGCETWFIVEVK
jgi:hypothetical protein